METCPNCGCRVYKLGCVNCDEPAYIEEQAQLTEQQSRTDDRRGAERSSEHGLTDQGNQKT